MAQENNNHQDRMVEQSSSPVINNTDLPTMDDIETLMEMKSARKAKDEMQTALDSVDQAAKADVKRTGDFMDDFIPPDEPEDERRDYPTEDAFGPQKQDPERDKEREDGYVRLRLRVAGGDITTVGAHVVDGPLLKEDAVHGGLGYELRLGEQRLALGTIIDTGEIRSFPPPHPTEEMHGHHIVEQRDFEFTVRVPLERFTKNYINELELWVFRVKGDVDVTCLAREKPVLTQSDNIRAVASLSGLNEKTVTKDVLEHINRILERNG